jgi:hypothetical protein
MPLTLGRAAGAGHHPAVGSVPGSPATGVWSSLAPVNGRGPLLVVVDPVDAHRDGDHQHVVLAGSHVRP